MDSSTEQWKELLVILPSINALVATKYLSAVGLVCALWDHIITLDDEVNLIWRKKMDVSKLAFFFYRYGTEAGLLYVNYMLSGLRPRLDLHACKSFALSMFVILMVISVSANIYIALYHYQLWDRRKGAMIAVLIALVLAYIPGVVLAVLGMRADFRAAQYIPLLDACLLVSDSAEGIAFWGCMVAFDAFAILLAVVNALDRPYREKSDVLSSLRRDGALWFISLFFLRLLNFIIFLTKPAPQKLLILFFIWAFISITLTRLVLRVEKLKKASHRVRIWNPLSGNFDRGRWSNPSSL